MACDIANGRAEQCKDSISGLDAIYIINFDQFDGDENAIVDFKYCADDRLTWWFDHHQSAFLSEEDEKHFLADTGGKKFLDTKSASCD